MNKNEYKKAMSGVHPSDQVIERIMDMTDNKKRKGFKKGLIAVLVVMSVLLCTGLTANAATDGAVADAINESINKVKIKINGKEVDADAKLKKYVDQNGRTVSEYEISIPENDAKIEGEIISDGEGVEFSSGSTGVEGDVRIETDDFIEPTTSTDK